MLSARKRQVLLAARAWYSSSLSDFWGLSQPCVINLKMRLLAPGEKQVLTVAREGEEGGTGKGWSGMLVSRA